MTFYLIGGHEANLNAQSRTPVFEYITNSTVIDELKRSSLYTNYDTSGLFEDIWFVKFTKPRYIQIDGLIELNLYDSLQLDTFLIQTKYYEPKDTLNEFYFGVEDVESDTSNHIEFSYLQYDGMHHAEIVLNHRSFKLISLSGDTCILAKRIYRNDAICGVSEIQDTTAVMEYLESLDSYEEIYKANFDTICKIRILAMYHATVLDDMNPTLAQLIGEVTLGIELFNQALRNSGIRRTIHFELAGVVANTGITQGGGNTVADAFSVLNTYAAVSTTTVLRNTWEADLMVFITFNNYVGGLLGVAQGIPVMPNPNFASVMVFANQINEDYALVHEISHLMGCNHQQCNITAHETCVTTPVGFGHAYRVNAFVAKDLITAVHTNHPNKFRALQYSNPRQRHRHFIKQKPMGIVNENDNARMVATNACSVADYVEGGVLPPPKYVHISGPDHPCPCRFVNLTSIVTGFDPSDFLTYQWSVSTNGFTFTDIPFANFPDFNFVSDCTPGTIVFYRLQVTNTTLSETIFGYHTIEVSPISFCDQGAVWALISSNNEYYFNDFEEVRVDVFPNPAKNHINLYFRTESDIDISKVLQLRLLDTSGKTILIESVQHSIPSNNIVIDLPATMIPGTYFLQFKVNERTIVKTVIIAP